MWPFLQLFVIKKKKCQHGGIDAPSLLVPFVFPSDWHYLCRLTSIAKRKLFWGGLFFFKYERVINKKFGHFFLPLKIWLILSLKNSHQILNDLAQTPAAVEGKRNENTWKKGFRQPRTTSESLSLTLHQSGFRVICNLRIIFLMVLHKTNKKMSFYTFKERFLFNVSFQFWRLR